MKLFVTVGSTSFDSLIARLDSDEVYDILYDIGITEVVYQIGRGTVFPCPRLDGKVAVSWFDYKPSLRGCYEDCDIVISHAGAGTILEVLRMHKPLVVVFNETLMHNHQIELAQAMENRGFLVASGVADLPQVLHERRYMALTPYHQDALTHSKFSQLCDELSGFYPA